MSGEFTNGFDMVVQLTDAAISDGLEMLPAGGTFPLVLRRQVALPVQAAQVPYDTTLELERPSVQLDAANNRVVVRCELGPSSELATPPAVAGLALLQQVPLAGQVEFTCPVGVGSAVVPGPDNPFTGLSFLARLTDASTTASFTLSSVTVGTVVTTGNLLTIAAAALQTALQSTFATLAAAAIGDLPLTTPIPLHSGPTPVRRLTAFEARILPPPGAGGRPAVGLGVLSEASAGFGRAGNIGAMSQVQNLVGGAVRIANSWLIQLVAETLEQSPGFLGVDLVVDPNVPNASFSGSVNVDPPDGDAFTLKEMTVDLVEGGGVRIRGRGHMGGFCWSADFNFELFLNFSCDPVTGALTAIATEPVINANPHIPWYCVIVGAVIIGIIAGALTNWIVGVVIGMVTAIILATIDLQFPDLPVSSIPGLFNGLGIPLPLPVGSPGLLLNECLFDDLAVRGRVVYVDLSPLQASGLRDGPPSTGFDLDTGAVGSAGGTAIDLAWLGTELQARNGCELQVVSTGLGSLTLSDLQALTYTAASIPAAQIPGFVPPPDLPWPFPDLPPLTFAGPPLVFAARTSQGRYAKCGVWRRATDNALFLSFETYASPSLSLSLEAFCETTKQRIVERGEERCVRVVVDPVLGQDVFDLLANPLATGAIGASRRRTARNGATAPCRSRRSRQVRRLRLPDIVGPLDDLVLEDFLPVPTCPGETVVHGDDTAFFVKVERAQQVVVRARPTLFAAPIDYSWTVFGTALSGSGTTVVQGVKVEHDETSPRLVLTAARGVDVVGQVCVLATDAAGRQCQVCIKLDQPGTLKLGGCRPCPEPRTLDGYLRETGKLDRQAAVAAAAALRLRGLAAGVKVPPAPKPVLLRDALLKAPERPPAPARPPAELARRKRAARGQGEKPASRRR